MWRGRAGDDSEASWLLNDGHLLGFAGGDLPAAAQEAAFADKSIRLAAVTREKAVLSASAVQELQSPLSGRRNLLQLVRPTPEIFTSPEGDRLISDNEGPGIPERDRVGIFSGKIRIRGARPTGGKSSSGMGLYLTGELAQRLGAKLTCEGTPAYGGESGKGANWIFENRCG